jgi:16S rRNA (cytosine1402-N4)-methyltransferase
MSESSGQDKPRRRKRYSGTHPKRFEEKYKEHAIEAHPELLEHLRAKGKTPAGTHIPILVEEIMAALKPGAGDIVADCTIGYGGHAAEFLKRIGTGGRLVGFDMDGQELERTRGRLGVFNTPMSLYHSNFAGIANVMHSEVLSGFDIIFADLGVSSMQIDNPQRGLSYKHDGPLDMRMDYRRKQTAADLLRTLSEEKLSDALWELSDEPDHEVIAQCIVQRRLTRPPTTTLQLVELIFEAKGLSIKDWKQQQQHNPGMLHPAARTFQALRIVVNDELASVKELLRVASFCLRPGGRIGIVSFHSGEDRLVKQAFTRGLEEDVYQAAAENVIVPQQSEIAFNPRSASAKFRWAVK